jgi:hypothetical protein
MALAAAAVAAAAAAPVVGGRAELVLGMALPQVSTRCWMLQDACAVLQAQRGRPGAAASPRVLVGQSARSCGAAGGSWRGKLRAHWFRLQGRAGSFPARHGSLRAESFLSTPSRLCISSGPASLAFAFCDRCHIGKPETRGSRHRPSPHLDFEGGLPRHTQSCSPTHCASCPAAPWGRCGRCCCR